MFRCSSQKCTLAQYFSQPFPKPGITFAQCYWITTLDSLAPVRSLWWWRPPSILSCTEVSSKRRRCNDTFPHSKCNQGSSPHPRHIDRRNTQGHGQGQDLEIAQVISDNYYRKVQLDGFLHRKWKYYICCLRDVILKIERDLLNSI